MEEIPKKTTWVVSSPLSAAEWTSKEPSTVGDDTRLHWLCIIYRVFLCVRIPLKQPGFRVMEFDSSSNSGDLKQLDKYHKIYITALSNLEKLSHPKDATGKL